MANIGEKQEAKERNGVLKIILIAAKYKNITAKNFKSNSNNKTDKKNIHKRRSHSSSCVSRQPLQRKLLKTAPQRRISAQQQLHRRDLCSNFSQKNNCSIYNEHKNISNIAPIISIRVCHTSEYQQKHQTTEQTVGNGDTKSQSCCIKMPLRRLILALLATVICAMGRYYNKERTTKETYIRTTVI